MKTARSAKRGLALLLCLLMFASLLPTFAFADLPTPTLVGASYDGSKVTVEWMTVEGAEMMRIYRKVDGAASWSTVANVLGTDTTWDDTGVSAGHTYTYTVRCFNNALTAATSGYDKNGVSVSTGGGIIAPPVLGAVTAEGSALRVTWTASSGTYTHHRIYRKEPGKNWATLDTVPKATVSYLDSTAKSGVTYTYTVRCFNSGAVASDYDQSGISGSWSSGTALSLDTPKLISAKGQKDGILFKWENVYDNQGFRVYRKDPDKSWVKIADVGTDVVEYLDSSAPTGVTVYYTVRALKGGKVVSDYNREGKSASWTSSTVYSYDTPELVGAVSQGAGILVKWKFTGTPTPDSFKIYRKNEGTSWTAMTATVKYDGSTDYSYLDNSAKSDVKYTYTVRCLKNNVLVSDYDRTGVTGYWSNGSLYPDAAPVLSFDTPKFTANSVKIMWTNEGAASYNIYRVDSENQNWGGNVTGTNYEDTNVVSGMTYTYKVQSVDAGKVPTSGWSNEVRITFYAPPTLQKAEPDADGVKLQWSSVTNAPGYLVYRDGMPLEGGYVKSNSFVDKTAVAGTTYKYKVMVASKKSDGTYEALSELSNEKEILYAGKVMVTKLERDLDPGTGVNFLYVEWNAIGGAVEYELYRKTNDGPWMWRETIAAPTTFFKDEDDVPGVGIVNGNTYSYYVKATDGAGTQIGTYDPNGKSIVYYAAPTLTKVEMKGNAVYTEWEQVGGIFTYRVFRKLNDASWQVIADVSALNYLDSSIASESQYTYTVACLDGNGNIVSARAKEVPILTTAFYEQPLLTGVKAVAGGIKVTWQKVSGAPGYSIFRKDDTNTTWVWIGSAPGTDYEFIDGTVLNGGKYSYTVACEDAYGNVASDYNQTGLSTTYFEQPYLRNVLVGNAIAGMPNSIKFSWYPVDGISTFNVYRKSGSGSWLLLAANVGTYSSDDGGYYYYVDTNLQNAQTYYYSVACTVGGVEVSAYDELGINTEYFNAPTLISATCVDGGVELKVAAVDGAKKYLIYRKIAGQSWGSATKFTPPDCTDTTLTFVDASAASGTKYTYTVRCLDKSGSYVCSGYDTEGKSVAYLQTPALGTVTQVASKTLRFSWSAVNGATKYIVYMKTGTGGWQRLATVKGTTYNAANLKVGVQYTFTVRAVNDAGDMSYYKTAGVNGTPTW